ncbi:hypothetical protein H072_9475 [Dactylellina haptotyla CBS 200.50]|uniref:Uncharacterized protein n=1 Tax=Dactylellina haptotyla (strain CBS 200.50) TaxID=1284197 RepID=S8A706_DACHA|nr:hypothetical protein H072_9475 [Dactylellina haptotyla CBS 200.50]
MESRRPKRRPPPPPQSPGSDISADSSEDDVISFLKSASMPSTRGLEYAKPKLTMTDILELTRRNKTTDLEIRRAQLLLEATVSPPSGCTVSKDQSIDYLKAARNNNNNTNNPSFLKFLKPTSKCEAHTNRWQFFDKKRRVAVANADRVARSPLTDIWFSITTNCGSSACNRPINSKRVPSVVHNSRTSSLRTGFQDDSEVRDILVSGVIADLFKRSSLELEPEIQDHILNELCTQEDEDLCLAYINIATALQDQFCNILSKDRIMQIFKMLGGSDHALNLEAPLYMEINEYETKGNGRVPFIPSWRNVSFALKLLERIAPGLKPEQLRTIWNLVIRLALDEGGARERSFHVQLTDLVEILIEQIESKDSGFLEVILTDMKVSIKDRALQIKVLDSIPTTSVSSHTLRRRLSLVFFSGNPSYLRGGFEESALMTEVLTMLLSADIKIPQGESHAKVQNMVDIVNIAIDDPPWSMMGSIALSNKEFEPPLEHLIACLRQAKESIQEGNDLNIEKSDAKDSFSKLILRLECMRSKSKVSQTLMEKYFRPATIRQRRVVLSIVVLDRDVT